MGDRPSIDKRFQKINVNRKIQRGKCCGGAQETSAYSRHGVAKAKIGPINLQNYREVQRLADAQ